jgi:hypothetical protein
MPVRRPTLAVLALAGALTGASPAATQAPTPAGVVAPPVALSAPGDTARARRERAWRDKRDRYTVRGMLIGAGVGAVAGFFAYRNEERKCPGCDFNGLTTTSVFTVGLGLGAGIGYIAGTPRAPANAGPRPPAFGGPR